MRDRLGNTREQELDTAIDELISIAIDRWQQA
jgi:2-oxo-4-hydroxy-4-carboxy--5-ureidoimidazoline (OHCU) decarboxylase